MTLTPTFASGTLEYTAATTDATNKVTAVAEDSKDTVAIKVNDTAHTNGTSATWSSGSNTVEVTVTDSIKKTSKVYEVTVTKS